MVDFRKHSHNLFLKLAISAHVVLNNNYDYAVICNSITMKPYIKGQYYNYDNYITTV